MAGLLDNVIQMRQFYKIANTMCRIYIQLIQCASLIAPCDPQMEIFVILICNQQQRWSPKIFLVCMLLIEETSNLS